MHLRHQSIINFFFLYRNANFLCHPNDRKLNTQLWKNEVWAKMGGLGEGGRPQGRRNRGGRGTMALSDFSRKRCKTFTFERPLITTSPLDFQIFLRPLSAGQMAVHYRPGGSLLGRMGFLIINFCRKVSSFFCNNFAPFLGHWLLWSYWSQPNLIPFRRVCRAAHLEQPRAAG